MFDITDRESSKRDSTPRPLHVVLIRRNKLISTFSNFSRWVSIFFKNWIGGLFPTLWGPAQPKRSFECPTDHLFWCVGYRPFFAHMSHGVGHMAVYSKISNFRMSHPVGHMAIRDRETKKFLFVNVLKKYWFDILVKLKQEISLGQSNTKFEMYRLIEYTDL
jgi:hypothetical protein